MNSIRPYTILAMSLLLLLLCAALPATCLAAEAIGEVTEVDGEAVAVLDGARRVLEEGAPVHRDETLRTGSGASLLVTFTDESTLSLDENSAILLDEYVYDAKGEESGALFKMFSGFVRMVTGAIVRQKPDKFQFDTPMATLGVRGTDFFARIQEDGEDIGVYDLDEKHVVAVSTARDSLLITEGGYFTHVALDGTLSPLSRIPQGLMHSIGRSQRRMQNLRIKRF